MCTAQGGARPGDGEGLKRDPGQTRRPHGVNPDCACVQVRGLRFLRITRGQVLIIWSDPYLDSRCVQGHAARVFILKLTPLIFMGCRCIKTFEVEFSRDHKDFSRINQQDTIFTSYVYSPGEAPPPPTALYASASPPLTLSLCRTAEEEVSGWYRVRAVDYWGRPGAFSLPETYTEDEDVQVHS